MIILRPVLRIHNISLASHQYRTELPLGIGRVVVGAASQILVKPGIREGRPLGSFGCFVDGRSLGR
jgi:ribonuclease HIII